MDKTPGEPPLEVFGGVKCPGCGVVLNVVKGKGLKTRKEIKIIMVCPKCRGKFRLRWTY